MRCPCCEKGRIEFKQDAILTHAIYIDGTISIQGEASTQDNTWIECTNCGATTDTETINDYDDFMKIIYDSVEF